MRPVTSETAIPRRPASATASLVRWPKTQILVDESAVDVEGDQSDRQHRLDHQRPAGPSTAGARSTWASRGLPDRSGWIRQDQFTGQRGHGRLDRRPLVEADLEESGPRGCQRRRQRFEQPPDDGQPIGPAIERLAGLEGRGDRQLVDLGRRNVGQVGEYQVEWRLGRRQQVRQGERDHVAHGMADCVLAREIERLGRAVEGQDRDFGQHPPPAQQPRQHDRDRAGTRANVDDAQSGGTDRPRGGRQTPGHLPLRLGDEKLRLRPGNQRSTVHADGEAVEFLEAPNVGHGLAGLAPRQRRLEGSRGVGPDRGFGMGDHGGSLGADGPAEQQLGVQSGALRP